MEFHGYPWISMEVHGYPWISMDTHGYPWKSMDIHGYPWGSPWISMDTMGIRGKFQQALTMAEKREKQLFTLLGFLPPYIGVLGFLA